MNDVQHTDGGSGSDDHDRCQIESKSEEYQHDSRGHAPPDRMNHDPVTEPAQQTAHLLPHPPLGLPTTVAGWIGGQRWASLWRVLPYVEPMLAGRGLPVGDLEGWAVEPKLDGWRCIVALDRGRVMALTRSGRRLDRTGLERLEDPDLSVILDAELIAGESRCEDFYRLSSRMFTRRPEGSPS